MKKRNCLMVFFLLSTMSKAVVNNAVLTETTLPLKFNTGNPTPHGAPSINITIDGKTFPVVVDTGAKKSEIILSRHALRNLHVIFTGNDICYGPGIRNFCRKEFIIPQVKIGTFVLNNVRGALTTKFWGGHDKNFLATEAARDGAVGYLLLSKYNILLDYGHAKMVLVKPGSKPINYSVDHWLAIPFADQLLTQVKFNGKLLTLNWHTGAVPSLLKQSVAKAFNEEKCPGNIAELNEKCLRVVADALTTIEGKKLPTTWFWVEKLPEGAAYDGLVGSNFYRENLVYFDFDQHKIFIAPQPSQQISHLD